MVNPNNDKHINRLAGAMRWSRDQLEPFRKNRLDIIRQYVGKNYSDEGSSKPVPFNLLELALNVYSRHLVAHNPRTLVTTQVRELKPQAAELAIALDNLYEEIDLSASLQMAVIDGLMGVGIIKVGVTGTDFDEVEGYLHDAGQPFADPVHLDDWVHDMTAKRFEQAAFMGNRYKMSFDLFQELDQFDNKEDIKATERFDYNERGDLRADSVSAGASSTDVREVEDQIELWDIWLPREGLVVTLPAGNDSKKPVRVVEWEGPEIGPYHVLAFNPVPNNSMPLPPAALWMDMHRLGNVLFRKLGRQAERQKDVTIYQGAGEEDAKRIIEAGDGETVRSDNPQATQQIKQGGVDQGNMAFLIWLRDNFSYFGGNLDALGGQGPQSETLGQDELLTASASRRVEDMQQRVASFTKEVSNSLAWYFWTDPLVEKKLSRNLGPDFDIPFVFEADSKEGDFMDYNLDIEPYSLQPQTPGRKLLALQQSFTNFIAPLLPVMEQQGLTVDMAQLLKLVADYSNVPEIAEVLTFADGTPADEGQQKVTNENTSGRTEHVRINRPGSTVSGKNKSMIGFLTGNGVQEDEAAAVTRPTG